MDLFTDEEIASRFADMFAIADFFCQSINEQEGLSVEIDPSLMFLAVIATYDDIARYKQYHLADPRRQRSNAIKRAAYAAKWLMRFSPLLNPKSAHVTGAVEKHDGLVNAMFAVHYAMSNIEQYVDKQFDLSSDIYYGIVYDLLYRNIGGEPLILTLEVLCKNLKGEPLFQV